MRASEDTQLLGSATTLSLCASGAGSLSVPGFPRCFCWGLWGTLPCGAGPSPGEGKLGSQTLGPSGSESETATKVRVGPQTGCLAGSPRGSRPLACPRAAGSACGPGSPTGRVSSPQQPPHRTNWVPTSQPGAHRTPAGHLSRVRSPKCPQPSAPLTNGPSWSRTPRPRPRGGCPSCSFSVRRPGRRSEQVPLGLC